MPTNLVNAIIRFDREEPPVPKVEDTKGIGLNLKFFSEENEDANIKISNPNQEPSTPRRGRPRKKQSENFVSASDKDLPAHQTNEPYINQYGDTNTMLKSTIVQIDMLNNGIVGELNKIKDSKTLRKKFEYISELSSTSSNLLATKISAIREMNKTITDSNRMELTRIKELNLNTNDVDDDKRIMDLYNAFVNAPVGAPAGMNVLGPSMPDITLSANPSNIVRADIDATDIGYQDFLKNMTPEQKRMSAEKDPNLQVVVMYDQSSGNRWFEWIDKRTGGTVQGIAKPDPFVLEDMYINMKTGVASNSNMGMQFPLMVVGQSDSIFNY